MDLVDFTNYPKVLGRAYNGANGKKIAVEYEDEVYMLKFPPSAIKKATDLSYTNGCISEHIASSIFNLIGIRAQQTLLGTYCVNGIEKVVCACKDFTSDGQRFFDFCSIKNTILDSDSNGSGTELEDVLDTIQRQQFVDPNILREHFWNVFVVDALLGNFDRHNGNWGFLFNVATQTADIAPVYDCGSCLLPQADEKTMREVLSNEDALNARVYQFPTSAIRKDNKKINYYDFLMSMENKECNQAVLRIVPRIDLDGIYDLIDHTSFISDLQKDFYKKYIKARYEKILLTVAKSLQKL